MKGESSGQLLNSQLAPKGESTRRCQMLSNQAVHKDLCSRHRPLRAQCHLGNLRSLPSYLGKLAVLVDSSTQRECAHQDKPGRHVNRSEAFAMELTEADDASRYHGCARVRAGVTLRRPLVSCAASYLAHYCLFSKLTIHGEELGDRPFPQAGNGCNSILLFVEEVGKDPREPTKGSSYADVAAMPAHSS